MAQVTTGFIYECEGHSQERHELAAEHPVIVVGRQRLIDNQGIAIVVPLTSTRPDHPVHWAVDIECTESRVYVRNVKSVHVSKIGRILGTGYTSGTGWIERPGIGSMLQSAPPIVGAIAHANCQHPGRP